MLAAYLYLGKLKKFIDAGERAKKANFDSVEVHEAHGYLLAEKNEFLGAGLVGIETSELLGEYRNKVTM